MFLPFGERVGEGWAVGTLRAVEAFAAAELGDLAEADREARRAYREFAAASDDWGRGFALVVRGGGGARAGRAGARGRPAHRRPGVRASAPRTRCCIGMAGTLRGFVALDMGDCETAERAARAVLTAVEPHNPQAPAQVGPRVLLATARLAAGDSATAVGLLAPVATAAANAPSLLFSRRQAMAQYAAALLAHGQREQALDWARRAVDRAGRGRAQPGDRGERAGRGVGRLRPSGGGAGLRARRRSAWRTRPSSAASGPRPTPCAPA